MEGWVKLYRKLTESALWTSEPFTKGQAWVDLIAMANHKDERVYINGNWVEIKRGQLHTSELKLAARWRWSKNKVTRFLEVLRLDGMLDKICSKGGLTNGTTLTLVNYSIYQGGDTTSETTNDTTNGQRTIQRLEHKQEYKECKEVKKDIEVSNSIESNKDKKNKVSVGKTRKRFTPPTLEELTEFCRERNSTVNPERFMAYYESNGWKVGRNGMKNWQQTVISWECRDREEGKIAPTPTESVRIETDEQGRRFAIWPDGTKARLGEGEFIQGGERRYRKDGPIVPRDADPRPDTTCFFNRETNKWSNA